jgi:hypothetical protein
LVNEQITKPQLLSDRSILQHQPEFVVDTLLYIQDLGFLAPGRLAKSAMRNSRWLHPKFEQSRCQHQHSNLIRAGIH